jgi:hypothetical protein
VSRESEARCYVRGVVGVMMFDLVCQHCGRREQKRWESRESVSVTLCRFCKKGMSVVGIAFFAAGRREEAAA